MKLGSLFDGSGGFPLAGALSGITPIWASEIEMYPIAVTRSRFPDMEHLGNVIDIRGDKIQPVDVITFGSPCQDLSVAGKRAGIHDGQRSNLFFEAIRIIREMRASTGGEYPKFAVWENVPGAFSSNRGEDFRCVLEAFTGICEEGVSIPRPKKWGGAGEIVGDGYSVAWRTLDAQYWGVPQRRKRIYLVADFAGERAGKILFERESVRGHIEARGEAGQGTAQDTEGSVERGNSLKCLNLWDCGSAKNWSVDAIVKPIYTLQGNGIDRADTAGCNGRGWRENICYTLNTIDRPAICFTQIARTLTAEADASPCIDRGQNVVCYDARGNGVGLCSPTLTGDHENRVTDYTAVTVYRNPKIGEYTADGTVSTMLARDFKAPRDLAVECSKPPRKYIIRRLTSLECCRLQGFPDGWGVPDHKNKLSDEEMAFWQGVRDTYAKINDKPVRQYKPDAMVKWYNALHTDSAEYKMWGNGIALPCAAFVLRGIAECE